jgi:hypothetical protein
MHADVYCVRTELRYRIRSVDLENTRIGSEEIVVLLWSGPVTVELCDSLSERGR